jgi:geranylgeranyl pyrophosphate synthase
LFIKEYLLLNITQPIKKELLYLDSIIRENLQSDINLIQDINAYTNQNNGKRLRSSLMLLIGRFFDNNFEKKEIYEKLIRYAASVETLHNATLVHDDIVDDSKERRGTLTVNSK